MSETISKRIREREIARENERDNQQEIMRQREKTRHGDSVTMREHETIK